MTVQHIETACPVSLTRTEDSGPRTGFHPKFTSGTATRGRNRNFCGAKGLKRCRLKPDQFARRVEFSRPMPLFSRFHSSFLTLPCSRAHSQSDCCSSPLLPF
ncbi:hypothetical protein RB1339 [Rhodopirellula baltica SH 1]|uniref:Uncharacterized protein n=1 Tax=Rhodopirellula baltica (strain DSM 10527 / NCIMB 13988 / SH1) TaxID=243090 RepID=Q7UXG7_RHOBA|nr:hypothetical protein RB1339 [Rhodopirellula baltica SH 1]